MLSPIWSRSNSDYPHRAAHGHHPRPLGRQLHRSDGTNGAMMREKLAHAQKILEALTTSNRELLTAESGALVTIAKSPRWAELKTRELGTYTDNFLKAVAELDAAAKRNDFDAAAAQYHGDDDVLLPVPPAAQGSAGRRSEVMQGFSPAVAGRPEGLHVGIEPAPSPQPLTSYPYPLTSTRRTSAAPSPCWRCTEREVAHHQERRLRKAGQRLRAEREVVDGVPVEPVHEPAADRCAVTWYRSVDGRALQLVDDRRQLDDRRQRASSASGRRRRSTRRG